MTRIIVCMLLLLLSPFSYGGCAAIADKLDKELSHRSYEMAASQNFRSCKTWPTDPSKSIVALATSEKNSDSFPGEGDGSAFYDLTILIVKSESGKILNQLVQSKAFSSDAIALIGISIDSAPYNLTPKQRAFGVRAHFANSSVVSSWEHEQLNLYISDGKILKKVLERLVVAKRLYEKAGDCKESLTEIGRTLVVATTQSHGKADLIIKEKKSTDKSNMVKNECIWEKKTVSQNYLLRFDGNTYTVPAELQY